MPGAVRAVAGGAVATEIGGADGLHGAPRPRAVRGGADDDRAAARRGCCSSGPTCARPRSRLEAPLEHLLAWVMVHEVTHAVQFSSAPWLRDAPRRARRRAAGERGPGRARDGRPRLRPARPDLADLRALVARGARRRARDARRRARSGRRCSTASRRRWRSSRATPSTCMDAAGAPLVPGLPGCAPGWSAGAPSAHRWPRSSTASWAWSSSCGSTATARRFCDAVVAHEGPRALQPRVRRARAAADERRARRSARLDRAHAQSRQLPPAA